MLCRWPGGSPALHRPPAEGLWHSYMLHKDLDWVIDSRRKVCLLPTLVGIPCFSSQRVQTGVQANAQHCLALVASRLLWGTAGQSTCAAEQPTCKQLLD